MSSPLAEPRLEDRDKSLIMCTVIREKIIIIIIIIVVVMKGSVFTIRG